MLKTFISYKWEDDAHNQWVEKFAADLRTANIDAQLDKWEIRAGDSLTDYMTNRIDDAEIILCIITDEYVKKVEAPHGQGGATKFEMQMAVSRRTAGDKVRLIGIYRQGSKQPNYLRDHLYLDFRDDAKYADQLKMLLDDLRGKSKRPPLGFPRVKEFEAWENSIGMKMVLLPADEFLMGSPDTDEAANNNEKPQHRVQITQPFLMGVYPVTQEQYMRVANTNPSYFDNENQCPVENVSWDEAIAFCNHLSTDENLTPYYDLRRPELGGGTGYRLPTEAEWEYACRAGSPAAYCFGDDAGELDDYAWFDANANSEPLPVGQKQSNAWGLYDMHGNIWEWCQDWYDENYYGQSPVSDPPGPSEGSYRVYRGGSWCSRPVGCRSAYRGWNEPRLRSFDLGFRVARSSVSQPSQVAEPGA